jgi:MFS family permease
MITSDEAVGTAIVHKSHKFLILYALAWAGGAVAYIPFLTVLLPVRVTQLTGTKDISWLAYITFFGAVAASLSNIGFGWVSDVTRTRRPWVVTGLILTIIMFGVIAVVDDAISLIAALLVWQVALNMMLAPLAAWAGDRVPDAQKGVLGGLTAFAPAAGAFAGMIVTMPGLAGPTARLAVVAAMVLALVLPVLIAGGKSGVTAATGLPAIQTKTKLPDRKIIAVMWLARLSIQIAEATLFAYLLFYFRSIDATFQDTGTARIFGAVLIIAVPVAWLAGRWMDRSAQPVAALLTSALIAATGLTLMASTTQLKFALGGYFIFGIGSTVFLALHSGQTLRVLYNSKRRGRNLGLFNLTNTIPSLIVPWLTLLVVPTFGFAPLIWLLVAFSIGAVLLLSTIVCWR